MNKDFNEGVELATALVEGTGTGNFEMILGVPYIHLQKVGEIISASSNIKLAAQNCHQNPAGAYTGEISVGMIKSVGADYVILGHSERRQYFKEGNELLAEKVKAVLKAGLKVIFCCGEPLQVREDKEHVSHVKKQLKEGLFNLSKEDFAEIVIAYEPIWAIGTGVTASPDQAQDMHYEIREMIANHYDGKTANNTSILYGGSVKPANAKEIFSQPDVDGGLVGGASLKPADFIAIANSF